MNLNKYCKNLENLRSKETCNPSLPKCRINQIVFLCVGVVMPGQLGFKENEIFEFVNFFDFQKFFSNSENLSKIPILKSWFISEFEKNF